MKLTQTTIDKKWRDLYHGNVNPFTPEIKSIDQTPDERFLVELSEGTDMEDRPQFGVTVVELGGYGRPDEPRRDLSKVFTGPDAKKRARAYIKGAGQW